jgi:hypothetical protein
VGPLFFQLLAPKSLDLFTYFRRHVKRGSFGEFGKGCDAMLDPRGEVGVQVNEKNATLPQRADATAGTAQVLLADLNLEAIEQIEYCS